MTTSIDDGGPAFPFPGIPTDGTDIPWMVPPHPGMSLRDWFAGMALQGMLATPGYWEFKDTKVDDTQGHAHVCFNFADAMLVKRKRPND